MTRFERIKRKYKGEFNRGQWKSGYIHVGSSLREIVAECRKGISDQHKRNPAVREARKAYYLGAICALREHRKLCAQFRI